MSENHETDNTPKPEQPPESPAKLLIFILGIPMLLGVLVLVLAK